MLALRDAKAKIENMTALEDGSNARMNETTTTRTTADDEISSSPNERRGCKRPLEEESSKESQNETSLTKRDSSVTVISENEKGEVSSEAAVDANNAQTPMNLPEGMSLEWNAEKTRAVLTVTRTTCTTQELRVCLVGRAKICVVEGAAEVLGHRMQSNSNLAGNDDDSTNGDFSVVVTSPYWSSWMTIEADLQSLPCKIKLDCIRGSESFWVTAPRRPIVLPQSWRACADGIVQDFCASLGENLYQKTAFAADSLEDYEETGGVIRNLDETRRICMITGAKGVGKSTLLRFLTNRILSSSRNSNNPEGIDEVAILDTDVGQPELAPPGLLRLSIVRKALLQPPYWNLVGSEAKNDDDDIDDDDENDGQIEGPSYGPQLDHTHLPLHESDEDEEDSDGVEVVSSVFFGASTSKVDPTRFMNAIQFLMEKYNTEIIHNGRYPIPLLINMDGWVKGVGYEILSALIESLEPKYLVQILGEKPGQIYDLPPSVTMEASFDAPVSSAPTETQDTSVPPKVFKLQACQTMQGASLCRIPAFTTRNFRWATYFLPNELQTIDAWDFVSADSLQTGWIVATNSDKTTTVPHWWHATHSIGDDINRTSLANEDMENELKRNYDSELNDDCRLANALARERPYCVPMEAVDAFVIGSDFEDCLRVPDGETDASIVDETYSRIYRALNGRIVALCTNTSTMESLGYGILRAIDWEKRLLYILVPPSVISETKHRASSNVLSKVKALVGGNLPLPLAMLYRGVYAESFPYLTSLSKQSILGSEPMKSRNNIGRRGLANAERNSN